MGLTLTEKILNAHIVDGEPVKGTEIGIKLIRLLLKMRLVLWHIWSMRLWVFQE